MNGKQVALCSVAPQAAVHILKTNPQIEEWSESRGIIKIHQKQNCDVRFN